MPAAPSGQPLNPWSVNKCPGRRTIDLVFLSADRVKVPARYMINMVLVAAENDRIPTAAETEVDARLALLVAKKKPQDELATLTFELREAPLPGLAKCPRSTSRLRQRKLGLRDFSAPPLGEGYVGLIPLDYVLNTHSCRLRDLPFNRQST